MYVLLVCLLLKVAVVISCLQHNVLTPKQGEHFPFNSFFIGAMYFELFFIVFVLQGVQEFRLEIHKTIRHVTLADSF